jgi:hypothetical protein
VDLDEILYAGDGIEYCLLYAYVGEVDILALSRTSFYMNGGHLRNARTSIFHSLDRQIAAAYSPTQP